MTVYRSWMIIRLAGAVLSIAVQVVHAAPIGQGAPSPANLPPGTIKASEQKQIPIPWPMQMGVKSFQVRMRIATVDKVVLVPDVATYIDEISRWTLRGRWPVLFEDDLYAPMFIRAFKPAVVVRRNSVGAFPAALEERQNLVKGAVTKSWMVPGSPVVPTTPAEAYASVQFEPFGLVLASMDDGAWPAALALASGHGQALLWLDGNFGGVNDTLTPEHFTRLATAVEDAAKTTTLRYDGLGDSIDAVTICRNMAVKAEVPDVARWAPPQGMPVKSGEAIAVTDGLCRNADGKRWAIAAWIFGEEVRSAYIAMSSLFLEPRTVWLMNTYPADGQWANYSTEVGAKALGDSGFTVNQFPSAQLSEVAWLNMLMGGINPDVLVMNSKGNMDFFDLVAPATCYPEDVPILDRPLALHLIHSWSLTSPGARTTVGGRWLEHGAYAYAGSVFEPYLAAFVPPTLLAQRMANYVPFLVASRWGEGALDATWRVTTIGDPLMVFTPPAQPLQPRVAPGVNGDGEVDLKVDAREALIAAKASGAPADYSRALDDIVKSGDDAMAVQIWSVASAVSPQVASACASDALGPLFRQRDNLGFLAAYRAIVQPSPIDKDMLWHLWTQQLQSLKDAELLKWFATQVRPDRPAVDLRRLAPEIVRVCGADGAREAVAVWVERTEDQAARTKVREVLSRIQ